MNRQDHLNFSLQENLIAYELPINEKARNFLKMEQFSSQIDSYISGQTVSDQNLVIGALIELSDFIHCSDFRKDLVKELEYTANTFNNFFGNPQVDISNLKLVISDIKDKLVILKSRDYSPGDSIRRDGFINQVRQKASIQGRINNFDLPRFYFWSHQSHSEKKNQIEKWISDILPLIRANKLMLEIIRGSSSTSFESALQGFFQRSLDKGKVNYLLRYSLPISLPFFPETSAGKQRFTVRFLQHLDTRKKPQQTSETVQFRLQIYGV
jgi:cell division protein ZapD